MALGDALSCAAGLACALRCLHAEGCVHGQVEPELVLLKDFGVLLLPPPGGASGAAARGDVAAFGAVLAEVLTGARPVGGVPVPSGRRAGREEILGAALGLAARCLNAPPDLNMQRVSTHVRLLAVLARQYGPEPGPQSEPAPSLPPAADPSIAVAANSEPARVPLDPKAFFTGEDDQQATLVPSAKCCPRCGGHYVSISPPRGWFERTLGRLGIPIRRCCQCFYRYFGVGGLHFEKSTRPGEITAALG
jgi:hypothetical protein